MNQPAQPVPDLSLQQLVSAVADAVIVADATGHIRLWNPGATRLFGFTDVDAVGQSLDLIVPPPQRERHGQGYAQTMRTGATRYGSELLRVPAVHKDGRTLSIAFTVGLISTEDVGGMSRFVVAVIRDETSRWQQERQLHTELAELRATQRD